MVERCIHIAKVRGSNPLESTTPFMNNRKFPRLGFNTIVQSLSRIVIVLLGLISVAILTRYLGVENYGNYSLVFAYLMFFGPLFDIGFHVTVINEINKSNLSEKLFGTYFWIKLLISFLSILIPILVLFFFPYSTFQKTLIIIGAIALGLGNFVGYGNAFLQARMRLDVVSYIDILNKLITVISIAILVYLKANIYLILSSVLIANIISLLLTFHVLRNYINFSFTFDRETAIKLTRMSVPIGIASILSLIYFRADIIMVSVIKGVKEVGIYSLSYRIFENSLIFWSFYIANFYPLASYYFHRKETSKYNLLVRSSIKLAIISGIVIIILGFFLSPLLVEILGGNSFSDSILPLRILLLSTVLFFINNLLYYLFFINNRSDVLVKSLFLAFLANILLNLVLIPKYSYLGASFSTIITEIILFVIYFVKIKRKIFSL